MSSDKKYMGNSGDQIQDYFSDVKNCYRDLGLARKLFTNPKATEDQYDNMEKGLGLMYLYCPEDIQTLVHAVLIEAEQRRFYFKF